MKPIGNGPFDGGGDRTDTYWINVQWAFTEPAPVGLATGFEVAVFTGTNPADTTAYIAPSTVLKIDARQWAFDLSYPKGKTLPTLNAAVRVLYPWAAGAWVSSTVSATLVAPSYPTADGDNLIPNPTSEMGFASQGYGSALVVSDATNSLAGSYCRKLDSSATNQTNLTPLIPCLYSDQFSFECYAKGSTATPVLGLVLTFVDNTGAVVGTTSSAAYGGSTAYQRVSVRGTAPTGTVAVQASAKTLTTSAASFLYIDNLSLRRSVKFAHMEADAGFRLSNVAKNSGTSATDLTWYAGSSDPTVNGGAPVLVDPLWALDQTYTVGQRVVAGSSGAVPTYALGIYVYVCTTAGAGMTTALNTAAAWSSATTYAVGNNVVSNNRSFTSKQAGNLNHTPTVGGDAWWTDNGSIYGPQGSDPANATVDNAAQWKCVGWMWGNGSAAGCMPWKQSTAVSVGQLMAADPVTASAYDASVSKLYGPDPYASTPFDPNSLSLKNYTAKSIYRCITAGTTAASGAGPTGTGTSIADGTATWAYFGPNSGPENRLQIWGVRSSTYNSSVESDGTVEFRIVPKTNADNLDGLTDLIVEVRDGSGNYPLQPANTVTNSEEAIAIPFSRSYNNPGTPSSGYNRVRFTKDFWNKKGLCFQNAAPYGLNFRFRCYVRNTFGSSSAQDFTYWNGQNLLPTPYALVTGAFGSAPSGGGTGGGGGCPHEDVMVDVMVRAADGRLVPGQKRAGDLVPGDLAFTVDPSTRTVGQWPILEAAVEDEEDTWKLEIAENPGAFLVFSARHRLRTSHGWVEARDILPGTFIEGTTGGTLLAKAPFGSSRVVRISVDQAHSYQTSGLLSSNIKPGM